MLLVGNVEPGKGGGEAAARRFAREQLGDSFPGGFGVAVGSSKGDGGERMS